MSWLDKIVPGARYFHRRTSGWDWFGTQRWWEIEVEFYNGFHGGGGAIVTECWHWNGSDQDIRRDIRHLSFSESERLVDELVANPRNSHVLAARSAQPNTGTPGEGAGS